MKITITIENESEKKVTTINPDNLSPLEFLSTEYIEHYLKQRKNKEFYSGNEWPTGKPFSETVSDENVAPLIGSEEYNREITELMSTPVIDVKLKKLRGKRGPNKKHGSDQGLASDGSNIKYLSPSTVDAIRLHGKELSLPGVQATKNKFIVASAYVKGRLDEAREQYKKYFNLSCDNKIYTDILTWQSWITTMYVKNQMPDRKIDGD